MDGHVVDISSALRLRYYRRSDDCGSLFYAKGSSSSVCGFAMFDRGDADSTISQDDSHSTYANTRLLLPYLDDHVLGAVASTNL